MAKIADIRAAKANRRTSLPESPAALREPGRPKRSSPSRGKTVRDISAIVIEQEVIVETEIFNEETTYEQRVAYDRFWQLFIDRIIIQRSSQSPESIAKSKE